MESNTLKYQHLDYEILISFLDYLKESVIVVDENKNILCVNRFAQRFLNTPDYEESILKKL